LRRWIRKNAGKSLSVAAGLLMAAEATRKIMTIRTTTAAVTRKKKKTMIMTNPLPAIRITKKIMRMMRMKTSMMTMRTTINHTHGTRKRKTITATAVDTTGRKTITVTAGGKAATKVTEAATKVAEAATKVAEAVRKKEAAVGPAAATAEVSLPWIATAKERSPVKGAAPTMKEEAGLAMTKAAAAVRKKEAGPVHPAEAAPQAALPAAPQAAPAVIPAPPAAATRDNSVTQEANSPAAAAVQAMVAGQDQAVTVATDKPGAFLPLQRTDSSHYLGALFVRC
jgi:hypothetical protein